MNRDAVIATLRANEPTLRRAGVAGISLFGSTARSEAGADSDQDIMIDIDPAARVDLYRYVGITQIISGLFQTEVDVAERAALQAPVRQAAERDAIYAF